MQLKDTIESLGGPSAVAHELGVTTPTIFNWQAKNSIPGKNAMAFIKLCRKYKLDINLIDIVRKDK